MLPYSSPATKVLQLQEFTISSFTGKKDHNIDWATVESFGNEWSIFDSFSEEEVESIGNDYFDILPKELQNKNTTALDAGCGTGRWSRYLSSKVGFIEAIDPSSAVFSAAKFLKDQPNIRVSQASIENIPFEDESFDLVFSLGVLHHIPDTGRAIRQCIRKVKPGGYFLVYLYYNLDNRGLLFRSVFKLTHLVRKIISRLPAKIKVFTCELIALFIYAPLALFSRTLDKMGVSRKIIENIPLSYYRKTSLKVIRNDALDRFGTPLEQRFSKTEIRKMMDEAGLKDIVFSNKAPYWHAIGKKG